MGSIGSWMSPSVRMTAACGIGRQLATWRSCARWPSTSSVTAEQPRSACGRVASRLPGMMSTCCLYWLDDFMRRPWVPPHGPSHRLDKRDLRFDAQAFIVVFDLRRCQACSLQRRAKVETGSVRFLSRETRQRPGSGGKTRVVWIGLRHGSREALSDMSMYDKSLARPSKTQRAGAQ